YLPSASASTPNSNINLPDLYQTLLVEKKPNVYSCINSVSLLPNQILLVKDRSDKFLEDAGFVLANYVAI
ncbi:9144_t:CDS:2, partial [Funneliformis mosseae]